MSHPSPKDRYRRVRRALHKIKKFHMKGKVAVAYLKKAKRACFAAILLFAFLPTAQADPYDSCAWKVNTPGAPTAWQWKTDYKTPGVCGLQAMTYFRGVIDTLSSGGIVSAPKGSTYGQAIDIVIKLIEEHPEASHRDVTEVILVTLRTTWPAK